MDELDWLEHDFGEEEDGTSAVRGDGRAVWRVRRVLGRRMG
jgi:hypothetical protein